MKYTGILFVLLKSLPDKLTSVTVIFVCQRMNPRQGDELVSLTQKGVNKSAEAYAQVSTMSIIHSNYYSPKSP